MRNFNPGRVQPGLKVCTIDKRGERLCCARSVDLENRSIFLRDLSIDRSRKDRSIGKRWRNHSKQIDRFGAAPKRRTVYV